MDNLILFTSLYQEIVYLVTLPSTSVIILHPLNVFAITMSTMDIFISIPRFAHSLGRSCRFDLLHFPVMAQSDAARLYMIAVVAAHIGPYVVAGD